MTFANKQDPYTIPDEIRAGDAASWDVWIYGVAAGTIVFYVLNGVVANVPTRMRIGGTPGVAVDGDHKASFSVGSLPDAHAICIRLQAQNCEKNELFELAVTSP